MFNFDTTFTKGKASFKIVDNNLVSEDGESWVNISAVAGNALIRHWLDNVIIPQTVKAKPSTDFDTLVKQVNYLVSAIAEVKSIKGKNCSYRNKSKEVLETEANSVRNQFTGRIQEDLFSPAQQLVIRKLSRKSVSVSSSDLQDLYSPVRDDDSKLQKWWKDLNDFDYSKYDVTKESILHESSSRYSVDYYGTCAKKAYENMLMRIEHFRTLVAEAGDDLINWSEQKISLRFTKLGIKCKAWEVSNFTERYNMNLKKKGVKKVDKKKSTSKAKLTELIEKGNSTVEDNFRYYKQASPYDASKVLGDLDLEHLYMIIDSDLKCIKNKLFDKWDKPAGDTFRIAQLLCEKSETKKDYKKIIKWATPALVTESFMIKHKDCASVTEVTEYCKTATISLTELINEEFYQTCLVKIPENVKFGTNTGLTNQYVMRMNEAEKVKMLKRIASEEYIMVDYDSLHGLYSKVNYNLVKDIIVSDKYLKQYLCGLTIINKDHASMITCATTVASSLSHQHKQNMFEKLTYSEKKRVIKADKNNNNFKGAIALLTDKENLELLSEIVDSEFYGQYVTAIFNQLKNNKEADKIVREMQYPDYLPLNAIVIKSLSVSTKVELLNKDIYLKDDYIYHSYNNKIATTSKELGYNFFNDFKREDINKVQSPVSSPYRKFLAHTMTKDELENVVGKEISRWSKNTSHKDLQNSFFRHNISLLSYSFVKKFKEKEAFRKVVGDRRDTSNKRFGETLLEKMNVSQTIDFMFS